MKEKYLIAGIGRARLAMNFAVLIMPLESVHAAGSSAGWRGLGRGWYGYG